MNDAKIDLLRKALKKGRVLWVPDHGTARYVEKIAPHAEEGGSDPCAIFARGDYAALYNCELSEFKLVRDIGAEEGRRV